VKGWEYVQTALDKDQVIEGFVKRRTKGGLIVDVFGIEAFLPGSQIDVKPIRDFDIYVNKNIEVKVVKINYTNDNVWYRTRCSSRKISSSKRQPSSPTSTRVRCWKVFIKNMTNFGVFIDLGGVDDYSNITEHLMGRIIAP